MHYDEAQIGLIRSRLLRYRNFKRINGRKRSWKNVHTDLMTDPDTKLEFNKDGVPTFSNETLRRFALGKQSLDSDWKLTEITKFLMRHGFLDDSALRKTRVEQIFETTNSEGLNPLHSWMLLPIPKRIKSALKENWEVFNVTENRDPWHKRELHFHKSKNLSDTHLYVTEHLKITSWHPDETSEEVPIDVLSTTISGTGFVAVASECCFILILQDHFHGGLRLYTAIDQIRDNKFVAYGQYNIRHTERKYDYIDYEKNNLLKKSKEILSFIPIFSVKKI